MTEEIQILTDEQFKQIYTNAHLRNGVAYAHACHDQNDKFMYLKALMYPISYKVTQEQKEKALKVLKEQSEKAYKENKE